MEMFVIALVRIGAARGADGAVATVSTGVPPTRGATGTTGLLPTGADAAPSLVFGGTVTTGGCGTPGSSS